MKFESQISDYEKIGQKKYLNNCLNVQKFKIKEYYTNDKIKKNHFNTFNVKMA